VKTAFLIFFLLFLLSLNVKAQQSYNSLNVKDLAVSSQLNVSSITKSSKPCPAMTQTQRDAIVSPANGSCIYNTNALSLNVYNGTTWKAAGGGVNKWATSQAYQIDDVVIQSNKFYICLIAHSSGTFATDLAASRWLIISNDVSDSTGVLSLSNGGTNKNATANNGAIAYTDADSFELLAPGSSGQILQTNGAGAPSFVNKSISGKAQNQTAVTAEEFQVSNNQLTQTDTNKQLIETGNTNILVNPSFEHSTASTGWTVSGSATQATEASVVISGKKSLLFTAAGNSFSLSQDSTLYAAQFADGVQCLATVRVKTSTPGVSICPRVAGSNLSTCVTANTDSKWGLYKIPFICGATSNGISISTGTTAGTTYIDDAFVGAENLKQDISGAKLLGTITWAATTNCAWTVTNASYTTPSADSDCPTPTVTGSITAPSTKIPGFNVANKEAGSYLIVATGRMYETGGNQTIHGIRFSDGTNDSNGAVINVGATNASQGSITQTIEASSSSLGSVNFTSQILSPSTDSVTIAADSQPLKFSVYFFPPANSSIYSASCGANCVDTFSASVSNTGTVSGENVDWINGNCSLSTSDFTCTHNTGIFTVEPNCTFITKGTGDTVSQKLNGSSSTNTSYRTSVASAGTLTAYPVQIICQKQGTDFVATRTIVGSFANVPTMPAIVANAVIVSARVSSTEAITDNDGTFLSSCTNADPSVCTFTTNYWAATPKCWANANTDGNTGIAYSESTTTVNVDRSDALTPFKLFCYGQKL